MLITLHKILNKRIKKIIWSALFIVVLLYKSIKYKNRSGYYVYFLCIKYIFITIVRNVI